MVKKAILYHSLLLLTLVGTSGCGSPSENSGTQAQADYSARQVDDPQQELESSPANSTRLEVVNDLPLEISNTAQDTPDLKPTEQVSSGDITVSDEPAELSVVNSAAEIKYAEVPPQTIIPVLAQKTVEVDEPSPTLPKKQPTAKRAPVKAPKDQEEAPLKREIKLMVEPPVFRKTGKGDQRAIRVSFDDLDLLRILNMEPVPINAVDYFPRWLKELDGKKIRLRGFMYPTYQESGIKGFLLARDNEICCFGRDPKEYDIIQVKMKEGTDTNYIPNRPFDVIATFHIRPKKWDEEKLLRLYALEDAVIINK